MISLQHVSKEYVLSQEQKVSAVIDVNLEIPAGEFVIITGRSGSGKTTLLNIASGLAKPTQGKVFIAGQDLWELSDRQQSMLRNQKIGFIFQFPSLLPTLSTLENAALPTIFSSNHQSDNPTERATELLAQLGLGDKLVAYPRQLSAGQQQRVVIARALLNQPQVLLADEPTSDLDEQTEIEIMELFHQIHQESGITIVLVTHSSELVRYGTRSIKMAGGHILNENL